MKQQSIDLRNEFQPVQEEIFFDEETVQRIPSVVPLDETPTRTSARRFHKLRVPMRKEDNSFNPAFLIMALVAVTALGVIAGTMVYRTASEKSTNATIDTDEPINRTIPAQYQFVVDKPESSGTKDAVDRDNLSTLPSSSAPSKKDSSENRESSSAPETEETEQQQQQQPAEKEETVEESEPSVTSDEPPPPPPPSLKRDRKETKKQDKDKPKNDNAKSETKEEAPPSLENDESSEN